MDADEYRRMAAAGERHWWYRSTRALLRQLLEPHLRGARLVLDAGGGTGATGGWMTDFAPVVLADYDAFALEVAAQDFAGVVPVRADLNRLPFGRDAFDAVLCVTALCHRMNPDPAAIVADFARLTRPGGVVAVMEPGGKKLWRGHDEVTHTARRFSVGELADMFRGGQADGEFRAFDPDVMAIALMATLQSIPGELLADPTRTETYANEVAELFARAVVADH